MYNLNGAPSSGSLFDSRAAAAAAASAQLGVLSSSSSSLSPFAAPSFSLSTGFGFSGLSSSSPPPPSSPSLPPPASSYSSDSIFSSSKSIPKANTAYAYFSASAERYNKNHSGKISGKEMRQKWNTMSVSEQLPYEIQSQDDQKRVDKEIEEAKAKNQSYRLVRARALPQRKQSVVLDIPDPSFSSFPGPRPIATGFGFSSPLPEYSGGGARHVYSNSSGFSSGFSSSFRLPRPKEQEPGFQIWANLQDQDLPVATLISHWALLSLNEKKFYNDAAHPPPVPQEQPQPKLLVPLPEWKDEPVLEKPRNPCNICFEREIAVVFLPCGHGCVCVTCSRLLKTCPTCTKPISQFSRLFLQLQEKEDEAKDKVVDEEGSNQDQ